MSIVFSFPRLPYPPLTSPMSPPQPLRFVASSLITIDYLHIYICVCKYNLLSPLSVAHMYIHLRLQSQSATINCLQLFILGRSLVRFPNPCWLVSWCSYSDLVQAGISWTFPGHSFPVTYKDSLSRHNIPLTLILLFPLSCDGDTLSLRCITRVGHSSLHFDDFGVSVTVADEE